MHMAYNHILFHYHSPTTDTLCRALVDKAEELAPTLTSTSLAATLNSTAEKISRKFTQAFTLFAACHNAFNSSQKFTDPDIKSLG